MAEVELSTLGAVIKEAYEGESDTNAFTDAEKAKLDGVESKRIIVYKGTTNASGDYTVTYSPAFAAVPAVLVQPPSGTNHSIQIISSTVSGFTVRVLSRAVLSVLALEVVAGAATGVSGASVVVTVVEA